jgi:DNA-binding response OmpR family regulator
MRALLVEDSVVLKRLAKLCLRHPDIEIEEKGLASCLRDPESLPDVDVAIVGTYLPLAKPRSLIENLASSPSRPAIVALMTDPRKEQQEGIRKAGADKVVTLPCSPDMIREAVTASIQERQPLV